MKRAFASLAGLIGLAALGRWLAQRRRSTQPVTDTVADPLADPIAAEAADDPAEELRRKLANARDGEPEPATEPESLDDRRARVHAKAREAIDAMADDGEVSP